MPGLVIWFTGLPAAGKSTLAALTRARLSDAGIDVELLDGDDTRGRFFPELSFDPASRDEHVRRLSLLAAMLERHGVATIVAAIAPNEAARQAARARASTFVEVFVDTPVEECIRRDPKGMYARALRGDLADFTGVSAPFDPPSHPELDVQTTGRTPDECVDQVLDYLVRDGLIDAPTLRPACPRGRAAS